MHFHTVKWFKSYENVIFAWPYTRTILNLKISRAKLKHLFKNKQNVIYLYIVSEHSRSRCFIFYHLYFTLIIWYEVRSAKVGENNSVLSFKFSVFICLLFPVLSTYHVPLIFLLLWNLFLIYISLQIMTLVISSQYTTCIYVCKMKKGS